MIIVFARPMRSPRMPKKHSARRPADHEDHRGVAGIFGDPAGGSRIARRHTEQVDDRRPSGQVEQLLVHRVEQPAERADDQHEPVVAV